jgi:hypothetical protein
MDGDEDAVDRPLPDRAHGVRDGIPGQERKAALASGFDTQALGGKEDCRDGGWALTEGEG